MTKREMLAFLDALLADIRSRGIVASGVARINLRKQHVQATELRRAVDRYVPNDPPPVQQGELKGVG